MLSVFSQTLFLIMCPHQISAAPDHFVTHTLDDLRQVECIGKKCPAETQVSFCKINRTSDNCLLCPPGSSQPSSVDSRNVRKQRNIKKCVRLHMDCPPEAIQVTENGRPVDCKCDSSRGFVGKDYMLCRKYRKCSPGMEFDVTSGSCFPCPAGTFASDMGYELCKPHTNCTLDNRETLSYGNATCDSFCGDLIKSEETKSPVLLTTSTAVWGKEEHQVVSNHTVAETVQIKNIKDVSLSEVEYRNSILTITTLVMTIAIIVLCVLLTFVFCKYLRGRPILANQTDMMLHKRMGRTDKTNDKPAIQAEDDGYAADVKFLDPSYEGIQAENSECAVNKKFLDPANQGAKPLGWTGVDIQPETLTIYPHINAVPCTPTAPSMTPSMMTSFK